MCIRDRIAEALSTFTGEFMQTPPAYSAIKRDGVPAYVAARRGDPLELDARAVTVHSVEMRETRVDGRMLHVVVDVQCGKGFYVRSLAHDLGTRLGVGGHVSTLRRTAVGPFVIAGAI